MEMGCRGAIYFPGTKRPQKWDGHGRTSRYNSDALASIAEGDEVCDNPFASVTIKSMCITHIRIEPLYFTCLFIILELHVVLLYYNPTPFRV